MCLYWGSVFRKFYYYRRFCHWERLWKTTDHLKFPDRSLLLCRQTSKWTFSSMSCLYILCKSLLLKYINLDSSSKAFFIRTIVPFLLLQFSVGLCSSLQATFYPIEASSKGATASQFGAVFGIIHLSLFMFGKCHNVWHLHNYI